MKKITYEFADGTKSTIEVEDALAEQIEISRREEENYERKTRYWVKVSLDSGCEYEGEWFKDKGPTPSERYELDEQQKKVDEFLKTLTPVQLRRLSYRMEDEHISLREIARREGASFQSVNETFEQIKKKYKNFFEN